MSFSVSFRGLSKISANEGIQGRGHPKIGIILKKFSVPRACFTALIIRAIIIIEKANFVSRWPQINWPFAILRALHSVLFL